MKKTVFEGTVNGAKYDNVDDYNKAVQAAINDGQSVEASSSTKIVVEPDPEEESCKKQMAYVPKQCCCEKSNPDVDILSISKYNEMSEDELEEKLAKLIDKVGELQGVQRDGIMRVVRELHTKAKHALADEEKTIDGLTIQINEIEDRINKLEEHIEELEKHATDLEAEASKGEEKFDKLSLIVDYTSQILEQESHNEPKSIADLWKILFS